MAAFGFGVFTFLAAGASVERSGEREGRSRLVHDREGRWSRSGLEEWSAETKRIGEWTRKGDPKQRQRNLLFFGVDFGFTAFFGLATFGLAAFLADAGFGALLGDAFGLVTFLAFGVLAFTAPGAC